jgi:LysM repeat protein
MENNDSNIKSQQTGGLKLMTVFIAVLALHVVVIGGFTVYHLMSGGSTDADVASTDKIHKSTDGTTPDASQGDKSAGTTSTTPAPTEVATIPATTPAPEQDAANTPTPAPAPAPVPAVVATHAPVLTPAPALTLSAPKLAPIPAGADVIDESPQTPSGPIATEATPVPAPVVSTPAPSVPVAAGPVHMPAPNTTNATASAPSHTHQQTYVVKITDSYKKIAHAHHITVAQLKEANHIKSDVLHTGQKLVIPSTKTMVASTSALDAPSTGSESVTPMTTNLASSSTETATSTRHHFYTIEKGDTLLKIAHKFKTTTSAILAANSIANPTRLTVGKKLKIPTEESRSAKNTPSDSTEPSQVQAKESAPSAELATFAP